MAEKQRELKNLEEPKKVDEPKSKPSKDIEDKIISLNSDLEATEKEIGEKQQELKIVNQHITKLQNLEISLGSIRKQLSELLSTYQEDFKILGVDPDQLINLKVDDSLVITKRDSLNTRKDSLTNLLSETGDEKTSLLLKKKRVLASLKIIYDGLDKENGAYRDYLKALKIFQDKKSAIEGLDTDTGLTTIKSLNKEIEYVQNTLSQEVKDAEDQRDSTMEQIYDELDKKISFYKDIYAPLGKVILDKKEKQKKTGSVLDFNVGIVFDKLNFPPEFLAFIDQGRDGSFQGKVEGLTRVKETIANSDLKNKSGVTSFIKELIDSLRVDKSAKDNPAKLIDDQLIKNNNEKLDLYNFLYGLGYLEVKYNITFNGKDLNENEFSPGEIGALLLIFYLLIDKNKIPLIIDQPEENLDNESVFTLLVPYIKQAKRERQIIIVTHNPNLAVVCDAEQIIVAEMDKHVYEIRYSSGSIENGGINKRIVNILEGTMPAFDNRKNKYMNPIIV